jgi:uncharacterized protein YjbI with pentapeptide repeats
MWRDGGSVMKIQAVRERLQVTDADVSESEFGNARLAKTSFENVDMSNCRMSDVNLAGTAITNVNLKHVAISDANTEGMTIEGILVSDMLLAYRAKR